MPRPPQLEDDLLPKRRPQLLHSLSIERPLCLVIRYTAREHPTDAKVVGFVAVATPAAHVAKEATHTIPIVMHSANALAPIWSRTFLFADAGALLTYGHNQAALHRRPAYYVDRLLNGAKPGDLTDRTTD